MISKTELAQGIRFAGERAAAAATHVKDWEFQLGHQWTTKDAFTHVASTSGGLARLYPMFDGAVLTGLGVQQIAANNATSIGKLADKSREEIVQAIIDGQNASAAFVETLDEADLAKVVTLGGYEMPKAEVVAQIWIHHTLAHSYEASARWPLL